MGVVSTADAFGTVFGVALVFGVSALRNAPSPSATAWPKQL
jgi:hypothetical protein